MALTDKADAGRREDRTKRRRRPRGEPMTVEGLQAVVRRAVEQARTSAEATKVADEREDLFKRYMAEPYGDEVEDRSQVVTSEIADTVEWILAALLRIFASTDKVVQFEPVGVEDEPLAEQETDYTNHVFWQTNRGFLTLYALFKDALMAKNGVAKIRWEERQETRVERYQGLTGDRLLQLMDEIEQGRDVELEVLEHEEYDDPDLIEEWEQAVQQMAMQPQAAPPPAPPQNGAGTPAPMSPQAPASPPPRPTLHDVALRVTETVGRPVVEPVPGEEFGLSPNHNGVFLDDCPLVYHRRRRTVSDLIAAGYERRQVEDLPGEDGDDDPIDRGRDGGDAWEEVDAATREIWVTEAYLYVDYDGDGLAELRKVALAGEGDESAILRWEEGGEPDIDEVEEIPFVAVTPNIVTHRFWGRSIAELVRDVQRIKTVLMRQLLDNVVAQNHPSHEVPDAAQGEYTIDDILNQRVGNRIIRTATAGLLREIQHPDLTSSLYPALEYVDTVRENRTGVTRYNQGLDANSLNQTATGISRILDQAQEKILLMARIFAETGVRELFVKLHDMLRRHSTKAQTVRLRNQWIEVDPRHWRTRSDVTVTVGLGTGDRDKMLGHLTMIRQAQMEHMQLGDGLVTPQEVYNTYVKLVENAGLRDAAPYFRDPQKTAQEKQQAGMDPVQAQLEAAQQQIQMEAQTEVMKAQAKAQVDWQIAQLKAQTDIQVAQLKAQTDIQVTLIKEHAQAQLKQQSLQVEAQIRREGMEQDALIKREGMAREGDIKRLGMAQDGEIRREGMEMEDRFRRSKPTGGDGNVNGRM